MLGKKNNQESWGTNGSAVSDFCAYKSTEDLCNPISEASSVVFEATEDLRKPISKASSMSSVAVSMVSV
jgi:hypothetical protein